MLALAEQPEGNGTGFVWDQAGHIVTTYHVLAGALQSLGSTKPNGSQKVAQVTLLGTHSFFQNLALNPHYPKAFCSHHLPKVSSRLGVEWIVSWTQKSL